MIRHSVSKHRGFSLLEVLVAVVILSVGLLALASLQLSLMRSANASKAQSTALAVTKDKLESLRAFQLMDGTAAQCTPATNCYRTIVGGTSTQTLGGITYTLTTTVNRYVMDSTGTFQSVSNTITEAALSAVVVAPTWVVGRDFKKVSVSTAWTDAANNARTVVLDDIIDGLDPADSAKVAKNSSGSSPRTVHVVIKDPGSEAGVIPIAIDPGNKTSTAATNPRPVINSSATETRFDILTYAGLSGGNALAQSRVETSVIGCTCDTATKPTIPSAPAPAPHGFRPTYWNGLRYVAPTVASGYSPPAGQKASKASSESPYCGICCRDHHDPASVVAASLPLFDPWRASAHTHYYRDGSDVLQPVGTSGVTEYLESCRLIRTDGIFRVAADFNNEYFNLLRTDNDSLTTTADYVPATTAATVYQNIVLGYLDQKVISNAVPTTYNSPLSASAVTTLETDTTEIAFPGPYPGAGTAFVNDPRGPTDTPVNASNNGITLQRAGDSKWLHSRGLYIDHLEAEALAVIAAAKQACLDKIPVCTAAQKQVAVLKVMPFTSINVTELSNWTPSVANTSVISVTGGGFLSAGNITEPVRGLVVPNVVPNGAQTDTGVAAMGTSNSGLAVLAKAIDADETNKSDGQYFTIPAGTPSGSGNFTVVLGNYPYDVFPSLGGVGVNNCTYSNVGNSHSPSYVYSCGASGLGAAMNLVVGKYNYAAPLVQAARDITCTHSDGTSPVAYTTNKTKDPAIQICKNFQVSSAASSAAGVTGTPATTSPGLANEGSVSETTSTAFSPTVSNNDQLTLNFTAQADTYAGYTCYYTGTIANNNPPTILNTSQNCP